MRNVENLKHRFGIIYAAIMLFTALFLKYQTGNYMYF